MTQYTAQEIILSFLFPCLGIITGLAWALSPVNAVRDAGRKGTLGDLNPTPWAMMLGKCIGMVMYAYLYAFRYWSKGNVVDLVGGLCLVIHNGTGLVLSIWFNITAAKLQYHDRLSQETRKSMATFVVRNEAEVRKSVRKSIHVAALQTAFADLEAGGMDCEEKKDETEERAKVELVPQVDSGTDDDEEHRLAEIGKLILQVTTQEREIPAPHEKTTTAMATLWLIIVTLVAFLPITPEQRLLFVGIVINCQLIFFYAAPLSTIVTVLKTRNSASIHIPSMITATFNGVFWGGFGIATSDLIIGIPNSLGAVLGFVQVALCVIFPRKQSED